MTEKFLKSLGVAFLKNKKLSPSQIEEMQIFMNIYPKLFGKVYLLWAVLNRWFSIKDRQALPNRFNVVYKLTCSCSVSYIGQTQRNLINRVEEHRTSSSSSACRHLQGNPDHRVDFQNPEVIGSDNWRRLQILESLWFKNTNQSWMQTSRRCLYAFLTCNRASCLTHDVTRHHYRRVSGWVMWLRTLRTTTSLPKQPFAFFIFSQRFSPEWPIKTCSMISAVQFATHWWW